jgi:hypothetical protein
MGNEELDGQTKRAVKEAYEQNISWMTTHRGIVDFILSEEEPGYPGNAEYDEIILANPEPARQAADMFDRPRTFRVDLTIKIGPSAQRTWDESYGIPLTAENVKEWMAEVVWVGADQVQAEAANVVDCDQ